MANQTVTTDLTLAQVISNGLASGQNITINSGAVVTATQSPTVLIGQVTINEGELLLDGANATNPIVYCGESAEEINVNGAGTFRVTLGWWEFPTTGNGLAGQTFDASTYFSSSGSGITADVFAGVWVETGRRINYTGGTGVAPVVGDWLFDTNDQSVHGRIEEVSGDGVTGYVVVTFLTGALSNGDTVELHTLQDNNGPDYQKSWAATVNGADVLETGVFQEFGNCYQNGIDNIANVGAGLAGLVYSMPFQSNTLTFGDGTSGYIPPVGARVRVPMVHACTSNTTDYATGTTVAETTTGSRHNIELANGGDCFFSGLSVGSAHFEDSLGGQFQASYCAAQVNMGGYATLSRTSYSHCIFVSDNTGDLRSISRSVPPVVDQTLGTDVTDCLGVSINDSGETTQFGGQTSNDVVITRCIQISSSNASEVEALHITGLTIYDLVILGAPMVMNTSFDVDVKLLKSMANLDATVGNSWELVNCSGSTSRFKLTGWEVLNGSCTDDSKFQCVDASNIECRGFHFFDDPFDNEQLGGTQGEEFFNVSGFCSNITLARCYQTNGNPNEFGFQASGTTKNLTVLNCRAEYAGEVEPDGINTSYRGLGGGSGNVGQGTGLETDTPGTAGAHFGDIFRSDTTGAIYYRNVPGTDEYPITVLAGSPLFTKDGDVDVTPGDQWEVDMGYIARGHTAFTGQITTCRNSSNAAPGVDQWTAVDIDFQYDTGAGFNGTWLDLRTPANLTGIIGMASGIRIKLRFTATASLTNGQAVAIYTTTTLADQQANLHPIDQTIATLTLTGLVDNSEVRVFRSSDNVELSGIENTSGGTFNYVYAHSGTDVDVDIVVHALGYLYQRIPGVALTTQGSSIPIQQTVDRQYGNP